MIRRPLLSLAVLLVLFTAGGASCPNVLPQYVDPLPPALSETPSLAEVIHVVNANSDKIRSFQADEATIKVAGFPSLKTRIVYQQSKRFRLVADTPLGAGTEVDLGSNDNLFWFWVHRNRPKNLYWCRHDRFATSGARRVLPVEPSWLIEALGVARLDPRGEHRGPERQADGSLKVWTRLRTPAGEMTKVTIIDPLRGWVREQHLYDPRYRLIASAVASGHVSVPVDGDSANRVVLPKHIEVHWPAAELSMKIDMGAVEINRLDVSPEIWSKPSYSGWTDVDLGAAGAPAKEQRRVHPDAPRRHTVRNGA